jgi:hypothetical protein
MMSSLTLLVEVTRNSTISEMMTRRYDVLNLSLFLKKIVFCFCLYGIAQLPGRVCAVRQHFLRSCFSILTVV